MVASIALSLTLTLSRRERGHAATAFPKAFAAAAPKF
jgi:hypothetical protein